MTGAEAQSADADTDGGWDIYPQVTQHAHTIVAGEEITDAKVVPGTTSVGVVWKNPTVVKGSIWRSREVPDGYDSIAAFNADLRTATTEVENYANGVEVTEESQEAARERVSEAVDADIDFDADDAYDEHKGGTDYKIADESNSEVQEVDDTVLGIDVGGGTFAAERVEEFDEDAVMVWYGGITGQFVLQALDFNGRPSARFKDDGYLVKGILQHPLGWFDRDEDNYPELTPSTNRGELASQDGYGRPPEAVRPLVLRDDIEGESMFIDIDLYDGGPQLSVTTGFNEGDWTTEEYLEAKASNDNVFDALDSLEGPQARYEEEPEPILVDALDIDSEEDIENVYRLNDGDGWQPTPDNAFYGRGDGADGSGGGSFDMPDGASDDAVEHPTEQEIEFAEELVPVLTGTGASPDDPDAFQMGDETMDLEGVVGHNADQFNATADVDAIREVLYEKVSHLDPDDLGDE